MKRLAGLTVAVVAGLVAGQSSAQAYPYLLSDDPAAMAAWRGSRIFESTDGDYLLKIRVDYAVYAPGTFPDLANIPGHTNDYVYAYQILNTIEPTSVEVSALTVGLTANSYAHFIGVDSSDACPGLDPASGVLPSSYSFGAAGAGWFFDLDQVDYGEHSVVLRFVSPNAPRMAYGSIFDAGLSDQQRVPSPKAGLPMPIPEPATLGLLAVAGLGAAGMRVFGRRKEG